MMRREVSPRRRMEARRRTREVEGWFLPYEDIEDAVFKYIEAVRAIGRTRVNTSEIAEALSLNPRDVERAARNLHARGVKAL